MEVLDQSAHPQQNSILVCMFQNSFDIEGNAGTASRFLTSVCALVKKKNIESESTILTGNDRMQQRPIGPLVEALKANGCDIAYTGRHGSLPLCITSTNRGLHGGVIHLSASISSQYVSSLLLASPMASNPVKLILTGGVVISQPYIDMTIKMMGKFGINVSHELDANQHIYHIPLGRYKNPEEYSIEGDASSATYPLALAAIKEIQVTVLNIGTLSMQGDAQFSIKVLEKMGCIVETTELTTTVKGPKHLLPLGRIDMESMTDAFLTASVLCAFAEGESILYGIRNQRVKECDRISVMIEQLAKFGVEASECENGDAIKIIGRGALNVKISQEGVNSYDDHRVAMSFSVLGCGLKGETIIHEKKCVEKTWPGWWDTLSGSFKVKLAGIDILEDQAPLIGRKNLNYSLFEDQRSIVLIGMRGVGKTQAGMSLAKSLSRSFIDMDEYLESSLKIQISQLIKEKGWEYFRIQEARLLQTILNIN